MPKASHVPLPPGEEEKLRFLSARARASRRYAVRHRDKVRQANRDYYKRNRATVLSRRRHDADVLRDGTAPREQLDAAYMGLLHRFRRRILRVGVLIRQGKSDSAVLLESDRAWTEMELYRNHYMRLTGLKETEVPRLSDLNTKEKK